MKKTGISLVILAVALVTVGCGKKAATAEKKVSKVKDWEQIVTKGELVVGLDDAFVPLGFRDDQGDITGFDVELAEAVTKELGVKVKFQPIEWSMKETELNNESIDVIWNGYSTSKERDKLVSYSNTYLENDQVLVTLAKNKITSYDEMTDKVLGIQEGSSGLSLLEENPEVLLNKIKDQEPVLYGNNIEGFLDLKNERVDGFIAARIFAEYYITKENDSSAYSVLASEFPKQELVIGIRKDAAETVKQLNLGLKKVYDSGEAVKISEKWFGKDIIVPQ